MTTIERDPVRGFRILAAGLLGVSVLGGCATVQREASFPEVRNAVANHLGQSVEWNRSYFFLSHSCTTFSDNLPCCSSA